MASHSKRDNECLMHKPKKPHFFKIILHQTIRDGKLVIPSRFGRQYGDDLSNLMQLKVPSGEVWHVELNKCVGEIWLQNGWKEFAHCYQLDYGHFLVFEYESPCCFKVLIFDTSASEIDYPSSKFDIGKEPKLNEQIQESVMEETGDSASIEIADNISPCPKIKDKSPLPCPMPHKKMRTNLKKENLTQNVEESLQRFKGLTLKEKVNALNKASSAFQSKNPYFMVVMQPSNVCHSYRVCIPTSFSRIYFKNRSGVANLCASDGRIWSVKYLIRKDKGQIYKRFCHGWEVFAQDINLEGGDVCVFELMKCTEISLKIVIFKAKDLNYHSSTECSKIIFQEIS